MQAKTIGHIEADDPLAAKHGAETALQAGKLRPFHHRDDIGQGDLRGVERRIGVGAEAGTFGLDPEQAGGDIGGGRAAPPRLAASCAALRP